MLAPLERTDSIELLRSHGCAGAHAEKLAAVCGDLPLVLTVVARETARPDCDVSEFLRELERDHSRLPALDAITPTNPISVSLQRGIAVLTPDLQRALALLQVFPQELARGSAAWVWSVEPLRALKILRELSMRHLVQHCRGQGEEARYRVHDLVRVAAVPYATEAELDGARFRHAQHYLALLRPDESAAADATDDIAHVAARIHADAANLYAALDWCTRRAHCPETARLLPRVHRAVALDLVLGPVAQDGSSRHVRNDEPRRPGDTWMPQLYLKLGDLCRLEGDYEMARRALERAVAGLTLFKDPNLAALAGTMLGTTYVLQGEMDRCLDLMRPYVRWARKERQPFWESLALVILGCAFLGVADRRSAALFAKVLALEEGGINSQVSIQARCGLSSALMRLGHIPQAFTLAAEALDLARKCGPIFPGGSLEVGALTALAMVCLHFDVQLARNHAEEALRITAHDGASHSRIRALSVRAAVELKTPSWQDAEPFVEEVLVLDETLQPYAHRWSARQITAEFMTRAERFDEALGLLESVIRPEPAGRIAGRHNCHARPDVAALLARLGRRAEGRYQTAVALTTLYAFRLDTDRALFRRMLTMHEHFA